VPLPKHLRQRWRYLGVGIESRPDVDLGRRAFQGALWGSARSLLGDAGSATVDLSVQRFRYEGGDGGAIVRTRRGAVGEARAVVAAVSRIDGAPAGLRVRGVSGTIRGCEESYIRRGPIAEARRDVTFEGADRVAVLRDGRADIDGLGATTLDL
jgi:ribonuclease P/MRP protein subunit POP5